ncbi:MAG: DUF1893 domain-containing protein [Sphaerochaetaceae bacterium]|jgi:hypothetical protein|nr:DUF1893 domain-containing protein [Sphaerochaetaceae bacterium]
MKFNLLDKSDSLEIRDKEDRMIFSSKGHWITPLLQARQILAGQDLSQCMLYDTKAGRAAACLAHSLGIRTVCIGLVSRWALDYYLSRGMTAYYDQVVDRLACRTEDLITAEMDDQSILALIESLNA